LDKQTKVKRLKRALFTIFIRKVQLQISITKDIQKKQTEKQTLGKINYAFPFERKKSFHFYCFTFNFMYFFSFLFALFKITYFKI
jgi:hypothetical protein